MKQTEVLTRVARLGTSRLHEPHESKLSFVSRMDVVRSKLTFFSAHISGILESYHCTRQLPGDTGSCHHGTTGGRWEPGPRHRRSIRAGSVGAGGRLGSCRIRESSPLPPPDTAGPGRTGYRRPRRRGTAAGWPLQRFQLHWCTPGPHRTRQRCASPVCDRPSPFRPVKTASRRVWRRF